MSRPKFLTHPASLVPSAPVSRSQPSLRQPSSPRPSALHRWLHVALVALLVGSACLALPVAADADEPEGDEIRTFELRHTEVKAMMTILRSIAGVKHVAAHEGPQLITVRDTPDVLRDAAKLVERHDRRPSLVTVQAQVFLVPQKAFAGYRPAKGDRLAELAGVVRLGQGELGLVGRHPGDLRLFGLRHGDVELKDLKVQLQARLGEAEQADMVLRLGVSAETHHAQHGLSLLDTTNRRAVDDGGEVAIELPVGTAQDEAAMVLLLTPRVVH